MLRRRTHFVTRHRISDRTRPRQSERPLRCLGGYRGRRTRPGANVIDVAVHFEPAFDDWRLNREDWRLTFILSHGAQCKKPYARNQLMLGTFSECAMTDTLNGARGSSEIRRERNRGTEEVVIREVSRIAIHGANACLAFVGPVHSFHDDGCRNSTGFSCPRMPDSFART